jgi:hypothetical protein
MGARGSTGSRGPTGARGSAGLAAVSFDTHENDDTVVDLITVDGLVVHGACDRLGSGLVNLGLDRADKTDLLVTGTRTDGSATKHENAAYHYGNFFVATPGAEDIDVLARGADGKWARVTGGAYMGSNASLGCNFWGQIIPSS